MKTLLLIFLLALTGTAPAQGPLTPPTGADPSIGPVNALTPGGLPQATMKTLHQVEPRTAIPPSPAVPVGGPHYTITQPGSYYLTGNIEVTSGNGIMITASNVTLDLNGFALISTSVAAPTSGNAVNLAANLSSIEIKNGRITGGTVRTYTGPKPWNATFANAGWFVGVNDDYTAPTPGVLLSGLTVEKCNYGIVLSGEGACLDHITVRGNGLNGIYVTQGSVANCAASNNGGDGIYALKGTVNTCTASSNGLHGVNATTGSVTNSNANSNGSSGIRAEGGCVNNCNASDNSQDGIFAGAGIITNCTVNRNGGFGAAITAGSVNNCTATSNGSVGIVAYSGSVTNSVSSFNFSSGIFVGEGVAAHCVAIGNSTDPATVDKQIFVTPGGQRDACVPASE